MSRVTRAVALLAVAAGTVVGMAPAASAQSSLPMVQPGNPLGWEFLPDEYGFGLPVMATVEFSRSQTVELARGGGIMPALIAASGLHHGSLADDSVAELRGYAEFAAGFGSCLDVLVLGDVMFNTLVPLYKHPDFTHECRP